MVTSKNRLSVNLLMLKGLFTKYLIFPIPSCPSKQDPKPQSSLDSKKMIKQHKFWQIGESKSHFF